MRHAIGFGLPTSRSRTHLPSSGLDLAKIGSFEFRAPDDVRWPALRLRGSDGARRDGRCGVQRRQRGGAGWAS